MDATSQLVEAINLLRNTLNHVTIPPQVDVKKDIQVLHTFHVQLPFQIYEFCQVRKPRAKLAPLTSAP